MRHTNFLTCLNSIDVYFAVLIYILKTKVGIFVVESYFKTVLCNVLKDTDTAL